MGVNVTERVCPVPGPKTVPAAGVYVNDPATGPLTPPTVQDDVASSWLDESAVP